MIETLMIKMYCDRDVNVDDIITCSVLCMHNQFGIEIFCPSRDVV